MTEELPSPAVENIPPTYEIGHFEVGLEQLARTSVKYIVSHSRENMTYILHADEKAGAHIGIVFKAKINPDTVVGGGRIVMRQNKISLMDVSQRFGQEPAGVRSVLADLLNERLKDQMPSPA